MTYRTLIAGLAAVFSSASIAKNLDHKTWRPYSEIHLAGGYQAKAITVELRNGSIYMNNLKVSRSNGIAILRSSLGLSPRPPILLDFTKEDKKMAFSLGDEIEHLHLCENTRCYYEQLSQSIYNDGVFNMLIYNCLS